MVFDYSNYVEVVGREADAMAYPYYPSDHDLQRVAPRLLSHFRAVSKVVPPSMSSLLLERLGSQELANLFKERVDLFDAIELMTTPQEKSSFQRVLSQWFGTACYVCGSPTAMVRDESIDKHVPHVKVRACPNCGWWESENHALLKMQTRGSYDSFTLLRRACLREFAIVDEAAPLDALRAHFVRHPRDLNRISPRRLELLVKSVFADFFSCEAIHLGGPGDGGYDLVLLLSDCPTLVQVKQRIDPAKTEPVSSIREFLGAILLAGRRVGIFVSTANRFSKQAQTAARTASSTLVDRLELVDASRLIDILRLVAGKAEPWRCHAHSLSDGVQDFNDDQHFKFISF
jgi:hypothetical protein